MPVLINYTSVPIHVVAAQGSVTLQPSEARTTTFGIANGEQVNIFRVTGVGAARRLTPFMVIAYKGSSEVHIGMTRAVNNFGRGNDSFAMGYAIQGTPFLNVHNMTTVPLTFNDGLFTVPPGSTVMTSGKNHLGIPLGYIMRNDDGLFERVVLIRPSTDIYYGLVGPQVLPLMEVSPFE